MNEFTTIYEFSLFIMITRLLGIIIIPLIFLFFHIYVVRSINKNGKIHSTIDYFYISNPYIQKIVAKICILVFSILIIFLTYNFLSHNIKAYEVMINQKTNVIEGFVTDFDPMPKEGRKKETFYVDSVKFEFSDYFIGTIGYNNAKSKGGAIDDSLYVRIHYYNFSETNDILKLEIKK